MMLGSRAARVLAVLALATLASACAGGSDVTPEPAAPSYSGVMAASEFVAGPNRFPFGIISVDGDQLADAAVTVSFYSLSQEEPELRGEAPAVWRTIEDVTPHEHAYGRTHFHVNFRGVYVVDEIELAEPGVWQAAFDAVTASGTELAVGPVAFRVVREAAAPNVGERVPATENPTIHDVASFAELSTRAVQDGMHEVSVAQALAMTRPFVVVFASPAFCVSAMCGPVTDAIAELQERFAGRAAFIHIEPWDLDTARNEGRLVRGPVMEEWRLLTEPWTFVVGPDGRVVKRFEGLVTGGEVEAALEPLL